QNGIYIVNRIAKGLQSVAFPASVQQHLEAQVDNPADPLTGSNDTSPESKGRSRYLLWHKRFAHMGEQKLKNLHQVTTLQRAIHKPKIIVGTTGSEYSKVVIRSRYIAGYRV